MKVLIDLKIFCVRRTLEGSEKNPYPVIIVVNLGEKREAEQ